jgi:hypothetical protein
MYIKILNNPDIEISEDLNIRYKNEKIEFDLKFGLTLNGVSKIVRREWLYLLALYKVEFPNEIASELFRVKFKKLNNPKAIELFRRKHYIYTDTPVYYKGTYAMSMECFDVCTNEDGVLYNIKTNKTYGRRRVIRKHYKYILVNNTSYSGHKLVAMSFIKNNDPDNNFIINHKNGIKDDNRNSNLEWSNYKHNLLHALNSGLNNMCKECISRNIITGEVIIYKSLIEAKMLNKGKKLYFSTRQDKLYGRILEFREFNGDSTTWFYKDAILIGDPYSNGKKVCIIKNGIKTILFGMEELRKYFNLKHHVHCIYIGLYNIKRENPKLDIFEVCPNVTFDSYDHNINEEKSFKTIADAAIYHNLPEHTIYLLIHRKGKQTINNIRFKASDLNWPIKYKKIGRIKVTVKVEDGENIKYFDSKQKCVKELNIPEYLIYKFNNFIFNQYKITCISPL